MLYKKLEAWYTYLCKKLRIWSSKGFLILYFSCVCVRACVCVCVFVYLCIRVFVCSCICVFVYLCVRVFVFSCICVFVYLCVRVVVYLCICVLVYLCTCVCIYVYCPETRHFKPFRLFVDYLRVKSHKQYDIVFFLSDVVSSNIYFIMGRCYNAIRTRLKNYCDVCVL